MHFTPLPELPPDTEAGQPTLLNPRRNQFESDATARAEELLAQAC